VGMKPIPEVLRCGPFTVARADAAGVSYRQLRGGRFQRLMHGVYAVADLPVTFAVWLEAARLVLPGDAVASHLTALRLWGLDLRSQLPLHFSTATGLYRRRDEIRLHRRKGRLRAETRAGVPCTDPARTYVDCATIVGLVELVQAGDHLIEQTPLTYEGLAAYLEECRLDGVVRARRAFRHVRRRVESPMETLVRLALVLARLPEPEPNPDVLDIAGRFVGRCDLVFWRWKVVVEYDGAWHERSARQRAYDRTRRENLEREDWKVVVVLDEDLSDMKAVVWRVYASLRDRGYDGRRPHFNAMWIRWFA
jgi:hypothetical protein